MWIYTVAFLIAIKSALAWLSWHFVKYRSDIKYASGICMLCSKKKNFFTTGLARGIFLITAQSSVQDTIYPKLSNYTPSFPEKQKHRHHALKEIQNVKPHTNIRHIVVFLSSAETLKT